MGYNQETDTGCTFSVGCNNGYNYSCGDILMKYTELKVDDTVAGMYKVWHDQQERYFNHYFDGEIVSIDEKGIMIFGREPKFIHRDKIVRMSHFVEDIIRIDE